MQILEDYVIPLLVLFAELAACSFYSVFLMLFYFNSSQFRGGETIKAIPPPFYKLRPEKHSRILEIQMTKAGMKS